MSMQVDVGAIDRRLSPMVGKMAGARGGMRAVAHVRPASPKDLGHQVRAKTKLRYRLRAPDGRYVNMDLSGFTVRPIDGWIGFAHNLEVVLQRYGELTAKCHAVPVFPVGTGGIVP